MSKMDAYVIEGEHYHTDTIIQHEPIILDVTSRDYMLSPTREENAFQWTLSVLVRLKNHLIKVNRQTTSHRLHENRRRMNATALAYKTLEDIEDNLNHFKNGKENHLILTRIKEVRAVLKAHFKDFPDELSN